MRAEDPLELETLVPQALALEAPVLIDVPFGEMPIPRAPQISFVYNLPWTQPQEGLITSWAEKSRVTEAWRAFSPLAPMDNAPDGC